MRISVVGLQPVLEMLERAEGINSRLNELRKKFAMRTLAASQAVTPYRTGYLRARTLTVVIGNTVVFVNPVEYARYVELGTGRAGGASWQPYLEGEQPPAYAIYWPGMAGMPYLRKPIAQGIKDLEDDIHKLAKDIEGH